MTSEMSKMASALSDEEFHRLQLQLIELKTQNYELDGRCKQTERELSVCQEKAVSLDIDLQKANKAINKSKKIKEVELLLQENDALQRKLQSQEDEFRLQNQTIMQELATLVSTNESLEKQLHDTHTSSAHTGSKADSNSSSLQDEVRRLQAQNAVLQKNLTVSQEQCAHLSASSPQHRSRSPAAGSLHDDVELDGGDIGDGDLGADCTDGQFCVDFAENVKQHSALQENESSTSIADYIKQLTALQLSLDTEREEKIMLKSQLENTQSSIQVQLTSLDEELRIVSEKLKRKQDSFNKLQEEKEALFSEKSKLHDELTSIRERDQKYYSEQMNKVQQEVHRLKEALQHEQTAANQKIKELQGMNLALQERINMTQTEITQKLSEQKDKFSHQLSELHSQLSASQLNRDDLALQLKESRAVIQTTLDQLHAAQQERDTDIQALQEINKVADNRKSLLDELAIKYQKDAETYHEKVRRMEEEHEERVSVLTQQVDKGRESIATLDKCQKTLTDTQSQLQSVEESKNWLDRRLKETEEQLSNTQQTSEQTIAELSTSHDQTIAQLQASHDQEISRLKQDQEEQIQECQSREMHLQSQLDELTEAMGKLKQDIKDGVDEKKIHEKKGMTMLKDLKRQLHAERKRAEKLQDKLQEVLSENGSKNHAGMDELFNSLHSMDAFHTDGSSVSSWNAGSSGTGAAHKDISSPQSPSAASTPSDLELEHTELMQRIAAVQQQKWNLEEKVQHLETSTAAMAEDLLQKTAIIEHYVMDGRTDRIMSPQTEKMSLKKMLEMVNIGDDGMREMNKKFQRMLEETLTKNMHLQQDLEFMSKEVVRLGTMHSNGSITAPDTSVHSKTNTSPEPSIEGTPNKPVVHVSNDVHAEDQNQMSEAVS